MIFVLFFPKGREEGELILYVQTESSQYYYPLFKDATYSFTGPIGITTVRCSPLGAKIVESNCASHQCMLGREISKSGEWRACLPNRVMIIVKGEKLKKGGVDDSIF